MDPKCLLPSSKKILSFFPVVSQLIHSTSSHTISGKSSLIFSHLHQGLPSGLSFFQVFPPKLCMCFIPPHTCHINNSCHRPWFYLTNQPTNKQTNQSTNSMEQAPSWEANKSSASHEISCIVWNAKVYTFTRPHHLTLSWARSVESIKPLPISWRSILILASWHLGLPCGLFHSGVPTKSLYVPLMSPIHATCPAHLFLHLITKIIFGEEYRS